MVNNNCNLNNKMFTIIANIMVINNTSKKLKYDSPDDVMIKNERLATVSIYCLPNECTAFIIHSNLITIFHNIC